MKSFNDKILNENLNKLRNDLEDTISTNLDNEKIDFYVNQIDNFTDPGDGRELKLELVIDLDALSETNNVQNAINKANEYVKQNFKIIQNKIGASMNRIFLTYTLDRTDFENSNIYKSLLSINKYNL